MSSSKSGNGSDKGIRESWLPLSDRYGVDLVVCGHDHDYERSWPVRGCNHGTGHDVATGMSVDTLQPAPVVTSDPPDGVFDSAGGTIHVVLHDAFTSRAVVIEPFDAPAALESRGITAKTIGSAILDQLRQLQASTRTDVASREVSGSWGEEINMEVPEVGISVKELSRLLKARFGHDLRVAGDLIETGPGELALTVRSGNFPSSTFKGSMDNWELLTSRAAEYVYSQAEPVRWAYYLTNQNRNKEAVEFSRTSFGAAEKGLRPFLLHTWATGARGLGDLREAATLDRASIRLKPDYWDSYHNLQLDLAALQDEEGAWRVGREMQRAAGGRPGRAPEDDYLIFDVLTWNLRSVLANEVKDSDATGGLGTRTSSIGLLIADAQINLHDPEAARLTLQTVKDDPTNAETSVISHFEAGRLAMETGDVGTAAREMDLFIAMFTDPAVINDNIGDACFAAPATEAAGHPDKADEVLRKAGRFVDCFRFRADILAGRGDWNGAQRAYADAVALAPDLPAAYYSWGVALAKHGNLTAAISKLKDATQRGPYWADPLKAWGDILVKQGHPRDALVKYEAALRFAPSWAALKEARDAAAGHRT